MCKTMTMKRELQKQANLESTLLAEEEKISQTKLKNEWSFKGEHKERPVLK